MNTPKVSVIIPVYNAEKTIQKCIDSVLSQTYDDLEIVIVDDGSKDNSYQICQELSRRHKRLKVIHQENSGPAAARNNAIEHALGKYLAFVDSDDYIASDMIGSMVSYAEKTQAQMVICAYWLITGEKTVEQHYAFDEGLYEGEALKQLLYSMYRRESMEDIPPFSPMRLVLRSVVIDHQLRYNEKMIRSEDFHFWSRVHLYCDRIYLLSKTPLYYYVENDASITHSYVPGYWEGARFIYTDLRQYGESDPEYLKSLGKMLVMRATLALVIALRCPKASVAFREIRRVIFDNYLMIAANDIPVDEIVRNRFLIVSLQRHRRLSLYLRYCLKYFKKKK